MAMRGLLALLTLALLVHTASAASPVCPDGIGASAGDSPKKVFDLGQGSSLLLCGWAEDKPGVGAHFSEFDLVHSRTRSSVFTFSALQFGTAAQNGSSVQIIEYRSYPLAPDFTYVDVPYREFELRRAGESITASCRIVIEKPTFTRDQLRRIDAMYREATNSGPESETIGVLVVLAAMAGNEKYNNRLMAAPLALRLDGHGAEEFHHAIEDLRELSSGKCSPDYDPVPYFKDHY